MQELYYMCHIIIHDSPKNKIVNQKNKEVCQNTIQDTQPSIAFQSDNFLQKAGGAAASSVIIEKLTPYYNKVGIDKLQATFNDDGTFEFRLPKATLKGTYALTDEKQPGDFTFKFTALGKIPVGNMNAHVEKAAGRARSMVLS